MSNNRETIKAKIEFWASLTALAIAVIGLTDQVLQQIFINQDKLDVREVHVFHHAPFWENLVTEIVTQKGLGQSVLPDIKVPNPAIPTLPENEKPHDQNLLDRFSIPLLLALAVVALLVFLQNRRSDHKAQQAAAGDK